MEVFNLHVKMEIGVKWLFLSSDTIILIIIITNGP